MDYLRISRAKLDPKFLPLKKLQSKKSNSCKYSVWWPIFSYYKIFALLLQAHHYVEKVLKPLIKLLF